MPDAKDIALLLGLTLLSVGVGAYDWRWAAILFGLVLVAIWCVAFWIAAKKKTGG